jgi:glucoamylase
MELNNFNLSIIQTHMNAYVGWIKHVQNEANPQGFPDIRINPKFELPNGEVFPGPWCRPQTDGPGLRSATLQIYSNILIENGQTDYVKKNLVSLIKDDLDWVLNNWQAPGCDLWE